MFARLAWDPELDLSEELELFYANYYGPAARAMQRYHEAWMGVVESGRGVHSGGRGMHGSCKPALMKELAARLSEAREQVSGKPLYERRLRGVSAGYEVARRVSEILVIKKAEGERIDTTTGPFAGRSSHLRSGKAERMFDELVAFIHGHATGDATFDQDPDRPVNIVLGKMRADILENSIFMYHGHEAALLSDF